MTFLCITLYGAPEKPGGLPDHPPDARGGPAPEIDVFGRSLRKNGACPGAANPNFRFLL